MRLVVKIGGAAMEDKHLLGRCARALRELAQQGHSVAVVHGGGALLTRTLTQMGKPSRFVNGLRVTDAATRDVALMVLAGSMNKLLVAALAGAGQPAIGICGGDGGAFRARKKQNAGADLGYVGEVSAVEARWLETIWNAGAVPVISSLALGADGEYYNINADQMAAACAVGCGANALIFITDVEGVKDADGAVIRWLDLKQVPEMVRAAVIGGGMLPKLEACRQALRGGVARVRVLPAAQAESLPLFYTRRLDFGTEVMVA